MLSTKEKHLQINFLKDILLYLGQNYRGRLVFSITNKNTVVLNLLH